MPVAQPKGQWNLACFAATMNGGGNFCERYMILWSNNLNTILSDARSREKPRTTNQKMISKRRIRPLKYIKKFDTVFVSQGFLRQLSN